MTMILKKLIIGVTLYTILYCNFSDEVTSETIRDNFTLAIEVRDTNLILIVRSFALLKISRQKYIDHARRIEQNVIRLTAVYEVTPFPD